MTSQAFDFELVQDEPIKPKKTRPDIEQTFDFELVEDVPIDNTQDFDFELESDEDQGFLSKAYRSTLGKVFDFYKNNEPESKKLIPIEGYEPPKPTTDPKVATLQLLSQTPDIVREEAIEEIGKLISENKLFTEEAVERLPIEEDYSRKVLLEGLGEAKQFRREISFTQAIREGQQESAIGILTGQGVEDYETLLNRAESELPFLKRQAKNISKIIGDLPAFTVGGAAGSLAGGGPETPAGAILGASGAFATQSLIESAYNEALRLVNDNPELSGKTFQQIAALATDPEALKSIGINTAESGAVGALVALNPLMKALEKTPLGKLFKNPIAKGAAKIATEVGTLTTVPAILQGKIPSAEDLLDNAFLLGGLKLTEGVAQKVANYAKRNKLISEDVKEKFGDHVTEKDIKDLDMAETHEDVDKILSDIESRKVEAKPEPKEPSEEVVTKEKIEEGKSKAKPDAAEQPSTSDTKKQSAKESSLEQRKGLKQPEQKRLPLEMGTEKNVPKKSEIIGLFKDSFKDTPIRIGKFPKKLKKIASGVFFPEKNVIRLKETGMIETAAHEFGHKLHMALLGGEGDVTQQILNINKALKPFMDELMPISRYAPHDLEGFAEFTRMYVTNPDGAKAVAPKFYRFFEKEIKKKAPGVQTAMLQARDMYKRYLKADPVARTYAHIHSSFDRNLWQKTGDFLSKNFDLDKIKTQWLDDMFPIKRAVADTVGIKPVEVENWKSPVNAYVAARVLKGWPGKAEVMLLHETFDFHSLKKNGKGLKQILEPIKTVRDRQELTSYMTAKRSQLLRRRGIKSGLDKATDLETIKRLEGKYEAIAEDIHNYQNRVLEYYKDSGMISKKSHNTIREANKFYVPFQRFFEESERSVVKKTGRETNKLQAKDVIKRIFGSAREIIDPLESIVNNTFAMVQQAEKNAFAKKMSTLVSVSPRGGKFMEKVPPKMHKVLELSKEEILDTMIKEGKQRLIDGEVIDDGIRAALELLPESIDKWRAGAWNPQENIVTVYRAGKASYYETTKEIAELFKNGGSQLEGSILTKALSIPARILRAGAILNPRFIQKNAIRDLLGGLLYTKQTDKGILSDVYQPFANIAHSIKKDKLYVDWLKSGGGMATMQSIDKSVLSIQNKLGKSFKSVQPIALLRRLGEISEEMNRLHEYSKAIEAMGKDKWSRQMAAYQSRDISIDFAKYGLYGKALNQMIPFWNATIQGGDKLVRTLGSKDSEVIQNFMTRATAGIIIPTLLLEAANAEDPDIAEIDETSRDTNWFFKDPVTGNIIQIPVPFETGILFHGSARRMYKYMVDKDPNAFEGFFGSIEQAAIPGFIPAAAQPFIEIWANKDFFRNRHIIPPSQIGLISEEQYGTYTSETAKVIGRALSYLPGVDQYTSGLTSPAIVDHFIKVWGAGLGNLAVKASDAALKKLGKTPDVARPEERLLKQLGLDAFVKDHPTARMKSVEQFYDAWDRWQKLTKSIESKKEKRDVEGVKRLELERKKITKFDMSKMVKAIQRNQSLINNIYRNPKLSSREKREMLNALYLQQAKMARGFMSQIHLD